MEEKHYGPIWFIPGKNKGRYPYCNSIYIEGPGILIDPASDPKRLEEIRKNPGVNEIWLTHWHEDHLTHLDLFDDLPLSISAADTPPISSLDSFLDAYGVTNQIRDFFRYYFTEEFPFKPRKPDHILKPDQVIRLGPVTVQVIATPGHTPGHLSFYFQEAGILFTGDYDLTRFGPWYGDVESSIEKTIHSINTLREFPARVWLTAHGQGIFEEDPGKRWDRYLNVVAEREKKLLERLASPRSMEEIINAWIIYGKPRKPIEFYLFGEESNMQKHLDRLMARGMVSKKADKYYRSAFRQN